MSWTVCIHGGAGNISKTRPGVELEIDEMRLALHRAVSVVKRELPGALRSVSPSAPTALVAAVEAVVVMEDSLFFNAGRGSCLTVDGRPPVNPKQCECPT